MRFFFFFFFFLNCSVLNRFLNVHLNFSFLFCSFVSLERDC